VRVGAAPLPDEQLTPTGFEHTAENAVDEEGSSARGTQSGTPTTPMAFLDNDLRLIVEQWSDLPVAVRTSIVDLVHHARSIRTPS
jgi:hypothetical protein